VLKLHEYLIINGLRVWATSAACRKKRRLFGRTLRLIEAISDNGTVFPRCFATSMTCIISGGSGKSGYFVPLVAIETRLFEGADEKSVAFSAGYYL
jgi:hypothetical protein